MFLRELVSNSQDAIDKARFLSIKNPAILDSKEELEVRIKSDPKEGTITITDSGIGMTKNDLVKNLGVVANSGTSKFLEAMKDGTADIDQIGQFGVGFYSAFLVADRVRVASKHPDDDVQHIWESKNGESAFHLYEDPRGDTLGRGTEITLYMKEDAVEYCDEAKISTLATYYSEFLTHPIHVMKTTTSMVPVEKEEEEVPAEEKEETGDDKEDEDLAISDEDIEDSDEPPPPPEMEEVTKTEWKLVNSNKPIWTRDKDEISDDEYQEFYNVVAKAGMKAASSLIHFNAEGNINFKSILFLPSRIPTDFMSMETPVNEMKLYVKKVLISDEFELLPQYLSFVKGVVDSDDLSLNVNRETLQENKIIRIIRKKLVRKVLEMINKFAKKDIKKDEDADDDETKEVELDEDGNVIEEEPKEEEEKKPSEYTKWFQEFGPALKMGAMQDTSNRDRLMKLLRYKSSTNEDSSSETRTLQEYVDNMKEWQTQIFYLPGENMKSILSSEFLDAFIEKDVEVLYFDHPIDEYLTQHAPEFAGKTFQAITKAGVKLDDEDADMVKRREKVYKDKFQHLTKFLKDLYGMSIARVAISKRLGDAAAVISAEQHGYSANMERVIKNQARSSGIPEHTYKSHRVFEFNPRHPFMIKLNEMVTPLEGEDDFAPEQSAKDLAWMVHDAAILNSGYTIKSIPAYTKRLTRILKSQLEVDDVGLEEEIHPDEDDDIPEDEEEKARMDELNKDLPPGYTAGEPQVLIP